jgi:hypothetical protein
LLPAPGTADDDNGVVAIVLPKGGGGIRGRHGKNKTLRYFVTVEPVEGDDGAIDKKQTKRRKNTKSRSDSESSDDDSGDSDRKRTRRNKQKKKENKKKSRESSDDESSDNDSVGCDRRKRQCCRIKPAIPCLWPHWSG